MGNDLDKDAPRKLFANINSGIATGDFCDELKAHELWNYLTKNKNSEPCIWYSFDSEIVAGSALLQINQFACNMDGAIFLGMMSWGFFQNRNSKKYEAFVCGHHLSHEDWKKIQETFKKFKGQKKLEIPAKQEDHQVEKVKQKIEGYDIVRFKRYFEKDGKMYTLEIYKAKDKGNALKFLEEINIVAQNDWGVIVETKEGRFSRTNPENLMELLENL